MDMPKQSSKKARLTDVNLQAASIVRDATCEIPVDEPAPPEKNPNAVALGRLGGLKGGPARASKLSAEQRSKIARKAAQARWQNGQERP